MDEDQAKQIYINPPVVEYSHQNPHPLFGKDPNILNAQGHTEYPKWVNGVIAKDKEHEKKLLAESEKLNASKEIFEDGGVAGPIGSKPKKKDSW